jgi:hypothetical protein
VEDRWAVYHHSACACRAVVLPGHWTTAESGVYGGYASGNVGLTPIAFNPRQLANTIAHEESHRSGWPDYWANKEKTIKNPP